MRNNFHKSMLSIALSIALSSPLVFGSMDQPSSLTSEISRELLSLSHYSMFDNLSFRVDGDEITLFGDVWWPAMRNSAEQAVVDIEGIANIDNQIEILPQSGYDDHIRLATARKLVSNAALNKYVRPGSSFGLLPNRSDIHIIVKNGNVVLEGVVLSKGDSDIAFVATNGVSGVFSVINNLHVENTDSREAVNKKP